MTSFLERPDTQPANPWVQSAEWTFRFLFFAVCAAAALWTVSNIRTVPADSQAVVFRFGHVVRVQQNGLLLAWPSPIEHVIVLPAPARQLEFRIRPFDQNNESGLSTGDRQFGTSFDVSSDPRWNSGFLLTGDFSVVHLQATLFYQISDAAAYVVSAEHVTPALERLFIASAVRVCAGRDLDSILVARPEAASLPQEAARRERLRNDLVAEINRKLDEPSRWRISTIRG